VRSTDQGNLPTSQVDRIVKGQSVLFLLFLFLDIRKGFLQYFFQRSTIPPNQYQKHNIKNKQTPQTKNQKQKNIYLIN